MSMISTRTRRVKPARRTARSSAPFGAGLVRFVPFAVTAPGYVEPSDADKSAAAAMFADAEPDFDMLAGEAAFIASSEALTSPPATRCRSCGELADVNAVGYCDRCDDLGTDATIKGQNGRAGLGYRVF